MQSHDQEVFNKIDFVDDSGTDLRDTVAQKRLRKEPVIVFMRQRRKTESEDEGHLNTSQQSSLQMTDESNYVIAMAILLIGLEDSRQFFNQ